MSPGRAAFRLRKPPKRERGHLHTPRASIVEKTPAILEGTHSSFGFASRSIGSGDSSGEVATTIAPQPSRLSPAGISDVQLSKLVRPSRGRKGWLKPPTTSDGRNQGLVSPRGRDLPIGRGVL